MIDIVLFINDLIANLVSIKIYEQTKHVHLKVTNTKRGPKVKESDHILKAVLRLLNRIKDEQQFPKALQKCNITLLHKKKARNNFENYRGIFRISVLRSILDRLIYKDSYQIVDGNETDENVGGRQNRSARDNIFVMGAVTNSLINGHSKPIQAEVMAIKMCFKKLWLEATIEDRKNQGWGKVA